MHRRRKLVAAAKKLEQLFLAHLEVIKWLLQLNQNINIHANNEYAFRWACYNGHLEIARWLCTLCANYFIEEKDNKIVRWFVKDENHIIILDLIENNKYLEAINKLKVIKSIELNTDECIVCKDNHQEIIKVPCSHTYCLESLIRFYIINTNVACGNFATSMCIRKSKIFVIQHLLVVLVSEIEDFGYKTTLSN